MICSICGEDKPEEEINDDGICLDCASSILLNDDIPPNIDDIGF